MKSLFLSLALFFATSVAFANTPLEEDKPKVEKSAKVAVVKKSNSENAEAKKPQCRVSCSANIGGIVYSAKAGSIFTNCETARFRCAQKLIR